MAKRVLPPTVILGSSREDKLIFTLRGTKFVVCIYYNFYFLSASHERVGYFMGRWFVPGALGICTIPILGPTLKYTIKVGKCLYVAPLRFGLGNGHKQMWSTADQGNV